MYLIEYIDGTYDFIGGPPPYPANVKQWAIDCDNLIRHKTWTIKTIYDTSISHYQHNINKLAINIGQLNHINWHPNIPLAVTPSPPGSSFVWHKISSEVVPQMLSSGIPSRSIAPLRDWAIAGANIRIALKGKDMGIDASYKNEEEHFEGEDCIDKADRWLSEQFRRQK